MADEPLRVGMVGVGGFGRSRRRSLRQTGLFRLVAAYDLNAEALAAAQREDGAQPVASFDELLAFPGLEAVIICTGGKFHAEQMLAAMARGLHVFVEKPLVSTPAELEAVVNAQARAGVVVGVGHHDHETCASSRVVRRLVRGGELGRIASVEATTCHSGGLVIKPGDWRGDPAKNPGGMLFQCGVHSLHELAFYFGPVREVYCRQRFDVHEGTGTADVACCVLSFASGIVGTLNAYHVTPYRHLISIYGTRSNLYLGTRLPEGVAELSADGSVPTTTKRAGARIYRQDLPAALDGSVEPIVPLELPADEFHDACGNVRSFFHACRRGGQPIPSLRDGALAVATVFAAEESARSNQPVPVARYYSG